MWRVSRHPADPNATSTNCGRSDCHGSEVSSALPYQPRITTGGLTLHIDGVIDYAH
jgi:hypothetical protein